MTRVTAEERAFLLGLAARCRTLATMEEGE
jgi:hypothetical protein